MKVYNRNFVPTHHRQPFHGSDIVPSFKTGDNTIRQNAPLAPLGKQVVDVARQLHSIPQRDQLTQSKPCKEVNDTKKRLRRGNDISFSKGIRFNAVPKYGHQRNDPHGLAYDPFHPTDTPLMQKADSFFAGMQNPLGN